MALNEIYLLILDQVKGMWRYKWLAVISMWVLALVLWVFVFLIPNQYTVMSKLYVDTDTVLTPLLQGLTVKTDVNNRIQLMTLALLSRPNLERVASETDISLGVSDQKELEEIINKLSSDITIQKARGNDLYNLNYTNTDPKLAYRVVEILVNSLVENTMGSKKQDTQTAKVFLEENIKEYEKRLAESEAKLADFKRRNVGRMPGDGQDYYMQLQRVSAEAKLIQQQLSMAVARRNELRRQLQGEEPTLGLMGDSLITAPSPYDLRITEIEQNLAQMSLEYTDEHPEVILMRDTLEELKRKKQKHLQENASANALAQNNLLDSNPVYQSMRMGMSEADVEVKALSTQLAQQKKVVDSLQKQINDIPEVEAQLARLNRDYLITKRKYEDLLQRLETAHLSQEADLTSDDVKFKIIEPPVIPLQPSGPKRKLFLLAALLASIGGGVALAFLLNQINPVFNNSFSLQNALKLPVFGVVSEKRSKLQMTYQKTQAIAVASVFAGLILTAAFIFKFSYLPLGLVQGLVG